MRKRSRLRLIILAGIALVLALWAGLAYVTRPAALRARLADALRGFDLRLVRVGEISFSPAAGLEVLDIQVAAAADSPLAARGRVLNPPPLLRVSRAHVSVSPWALLLGEFRPREVELEATAIAVIWPSADAPKPWGPGGADSFATLHEPSADLPRLVIKRADIEVFSVEDARLRLQRRWVVDGSGTLVEGDGREPRAYVLRLDQVAGPVSAKYGRDSPLAEVHWQAGRLVAALGWVDIELLQALLPTKLTGFIEHLHLSGQARAKRLVWDAAGLASAEVECDRLRCVIPIESDEETPDHEHYARLTDTTVALAFVRADSAAADESARLRGQAHVRLDGRLNGASATLELRIDDLGLASGGSAVGTDQGAATILDDLELGPYRAELRVAGLTLPTLRDNPRFVTSERLPEALRSWIRKYDADGLVNIHVVLDGDGWAARGSTSGTPTKVSLRYRGELEALDGSCCYSRFPYRIHDYRGFVRFSNDGIVFDGLHGRHGSDRIRMDGRLVDSKSWTGFELRFRGCNIASDAELYAALPAEYQAVWRDADPVGLWDVQVDLSREHGSEQVGSLPTQTRVTARLLSGSLNLQDGSRLENAEGLIRIAGGRIELEDLHGYVRGSPLRVSGTITLTDGDEPPEHNVHIEAADVALRRTFEVRAADGETVGQIQFEGVGNVLGQFRSGTAAQEHYAVHVKEGVLTGFEPGAYWDQTTGWISVHDGQQQIQSLTALRDDGRLAVSGTLPTQLGLDRPILLDLHADDADMDRLLRQLVPGRWSSIREALGLAGCGVLAARFHPQSVDGAPAQQAADIWLEAECMRPTPLPLDLRDITASLTLRAAGFDLHEAVASYGAQGRLAVSGHGAWADGNIWSDVKVKAQRLELTGELVEALPEPLASLLKRMNPRGHMDVALDQVLLTGSPERAWNVVGEVQLKEAELNVGVPLTGFDGRLEGRCEIGADGETMLEAEFTIEHGRLASRPIERWEGRLRRRPGSRLLYIDDVRGRLCGGEVVGFAVVDPDSSTYELSLTLHDVSLDEFRQRERTASERRSPGRLDGHIFVRGDIEDPSRRSGGGELRIRGTSLLSSPVTASVVQASERQERSISDEVERAELWFVWEGQELKFSRVDIHSRDLRLVGMGRWNMRSDAISMTLLGATPEDAPRLFLLTELLESAGQELMQYRVEGTAAEPHVTVEPLHNLTQPLRALLRGE